MPAEPGQRILEVTPEPLNRVEFWAIRRQEHEAYIRREGELLGGMRPPIIQEHDMQAVRARLRKEVDNDLEHLGMQSGPFQEAPFSRDCLYGAIDVEPLEDMLNLTERLHAARGEAPTANRQETEAALILAQHAYWTRMGRWDDLLEAFPTRRLEGGNGLRGFWCDSVGPLGAWP